MPGYFDMHIDQDQIPGTMGFQVVQRHDAGRCQDSGDYLPLAIAIH